MAENRDENPFSFKKYVEKKSSFVESDDSDSGTADCRNPMDLLNGTQHHGDDREEQEKRRRPEDNNPFSFKKFLQSDVKRSSSSHGSLSTFDLANDLPDFVQGHYPSDRYRVPAAEGTLPDFALGLKDDSVLPSVSPDSSFSEEDLKGSGGNVATNQPNRFSSPNLHHNGHSVLSDGVNDDDSDDDLSMMLHGAHATGGLPDFLSDASGIAAASDGAIPKHDHHHNGFLFPTSNKTNEEMRVEIKRLQEENQRLRAELDMARQAAEREAQRVERVHADMVTARQKEAEETAALENMVQQVEANLQTSVKRAQKAESTIVKLKQEVASLKGEVTSLRSENMKLQEGGVADVVRDKTKYASEQLAATAKAAETNLKQMLKGVDSLKLLSDILASVETISEVGSSDRGASSPEQPPDPLS